MRIVFALVAALLLGSIAAQAQAACSGTLPLASPVTVAVGATVHVTPLDQNCVPIPNDPVTSKLSLLQMTGIATWAVDGSGPGINITGVAPGTAPSVQIQWADQYSTHSAVKSAFFTVNVTAPAPLVTAVGSVSP